MRSRGSGLSDDEQRLEFVPRMSERELGRCAETALLAAIALWLALACTAGAAETGALAPARPTYSFLPQREDWTFLRDATDAERTDFFDPIKYIPLSDDGKFWASFGGSARLRLENWSSFAFLPKARGDDTFLLWRGRVHADVHLGEHFRVFGEGKSALATDRDLPGQTSNAYVDSIALQQLFVDARFAVADTGATVTARAGRQMYQYGRQRLVSPLPWGNTLRSWDGLTGIVEGDAWRIDAFGSLFDPVRKYDFNKPDEDTVFYGAYATGRLPCQSATLDLYFLGLGVDQTRVVNGSAGNEDRFTFGARLSGTLIGSALDYDIEAAYQSGRIGSANVSAWMLGSQFGYTLADTWSKPRAHIGLELGSGDDHPGGNVQTFNQLYPLGHAFLGYIDLVGRQNAISPEFGVEFHPLDALKLAITGMVFWRYSNADALYNAGGAVVRAGGLGSASHIGEEIDFTGSYRLDRHAVLLIGYSHFFAGDFIEESGPDHDIDFVYLEFTYTF